jgi:signal transduction histidine kinase
MNWRKWIRYLVPTEEKEEPQFRKEMERLSITGLRVIGGVCLAGPLFFSLMGFTLLPEVRDGIRRFGHEGPLAFLLLGLGALALSFWPLARSRARLIGLGVGYLVALVEFWGHMNTVGSPQEGWFVISGILTGVMLVGVAALPVKPLQILALGSAIGVTYAGLLLAPGLLPLLEGQLQVPLVIVAYVVLLSTALTAVVYHQRVSAYNARRAAEEAFELLRVAQVRVCVSENDASQGRFAAAMSHELNSPLGALTSAFDTLVQTHERVQSHPEQLKRLEEVFEQAARSGRQSTKRLRETLGRMKHLTNLDRAEERVVDLNELWTDTIALLEPELEPRAEVNLDLSPIPPIKCRPQQMGAVFSNLLRNAAAAMDRKGHIRISSQARNGEIVLEVQDDGRGIPAEQLEDLFDPAFRADRGRVSTTHWGLFITRTIVSEHGGHIELDSKEGQGTTARVLLPVAANRQSECAGCSAT